MQSEGAALTCSGGSTSTSSAELVAELASAVDRGDRERIASCYTEDSLDDHGVFKGTGAEFAEFVCGPGFLTTMHHLLGPVGLRRRR